MGDTSSIKRKRILFVDDEVRFLELLQELFTEMSKDTWEIHVAHNHAEMLARLQRYRMDLVVLDIGMPVMDGVQLLRLLGRTHPGQQVVMLTGQVTEENRRNCLDNGAVLILQKPVSTPEFASIFSALDSLAGARANEGFQGVMQRVGLSEVLQFECLGRRSSLLEVFTGKTRGNIYIHDGAIVHAEFGNLKGEVALYGLLGLRGGGFNLLPFREPAQRTIEGSWEMLLMEAARLSDEAALSSPEPAEPPPEVGADLPASPEPDLAPPPLPKASAAATPLPTTPPPRQVPSPTLPAAASPTPEEATQFFRSAPPALQAARIVEVLLCSGAGEVLYDWECTSLERRLALLEQVEQQAVRFSELGPVGRFDRLEVVTAEDRSVCQVQPHRRLFVRSVPHPEEIA